VEYTDRATWQAAVGAVTTIGFEGLAGPSGVDPIPSITVDGVTFAGQSGPVLSGASAMADPTVTPVSASANDYVNAWQSGDMLQAGLGGILITLPEGTRAFGVDIMTTFLAFMPDSKTSSFEAILSDGEIFDGLTTYAPPTRGFVGFVSSSPISSVYFNSTSSFPMIDNFSFTSDNPASASATPEPSTWSVTVAGAFLVGVAFALRRRKDLAEARTR